MCVLCAVRLSSSWFYKPCRLYGPLSSSSPLLLQANSLTVSSPLPETLNCVTGASEFLYRLQNNETLLFLKAAGSSKSSPLLSKSRCTRISLQADDDDYDDLRFTHFPSVYLLTLDPRPLPDCLAEDKSLSPIHRIFTCVTIGLV